METRKVLAAAGQRVVLMRGKAVLRRATTDAEGSPSSLSLMIGDDGLYDGRSYSKAAVPGPVTVPWDKRHKRLVADGSLVIVEDNAAAEVEPSVSIKPSRRTAKE